jgi:hypothetical protein
MSPKLKSELAASDERRPQKVASFTQRILKSGVKFAVGSDMCWFYPGKTRGQATATMFANLHDAGMPSLEIIRAVTVNAAEVLGWQDRVGAVEPGKFADLVAVSGDPISDITELEGVRFVITNRELFDSVRLGLEIGAALEKLYPGKISFAASRKLIGADATVRALQAGEDPRTIEQQLEAPLQQFLQIREKYLRYR